MIVIKTDRLVNAARDAFLRLYDSGDSNASDPTILREDSATIEITEPGRNPPAFRLSNHQLSYIGDYNKYFPYLDSRIPEVEQNYFTETFVRDQQIYKIADYLKGHSSSKRALISIWSPRFLQQPKEEAACITQLYFRLRNERLELHSHSRANDAYRLLLLDMQFATWVQTEVASRLGVPCNRYIHFVDSLQLYEKHSESIEKQRRYILTASYWQDEH